jgi:hypothetical protein
MLQGLDIMQPQQNMGAVEFCRCISSIPLLRHETRDCWHGGDVSWHDIATGVGDWLLGAAKQVHKMCPILPAAAYWRSWFPHDLPALLFCCL